MFDGLEHMLWWTETCCFDGLKHIFDGLIFLWTDTSRFEVLTHIFDGLKWRCFDGPKHIFLKDWSMFLIDWSIWFDGPKTETYLFDGEKHFCWWTETYPLMDWNIFLMDWNRFFMYWNIMFHRLKHMFWGTETFFDGLEHFLMDGSVCADGMKYMCWWTEP